MTRLLYALFASVFFLDFLRVEFSIPRAFLFLPELLSGVALVLCIVEYSKKGFLQLSAKYVLLASVFFLTVCFGFVVAEATSGPVVGGVRLYGKYLAFFFVPLVFHITEKELRMQLLVILAFLLVQLPVTLIQRFVVYAGRSGDDARGTLSTGSMTAIALTMGLSILVGLYQHGFLTRNRALFFGLAMALAPMFAEAKGAFLLLPLALLIPAFLAPKQETVGALRNIGVTIACGLVLSLFAVVYNLVESSYSGRAGGDEYRVSIIEFYRDPSRLLSYMAPQLAGNENPDRIGRIDSIAAPIVEFWGDPRRMIAGLGFGALASSPFAVFSSDQHDHISEGGLDKAALSVIIWEFGYLGFFLIVMGQILIWRDARRLSRVRSIEGGLALGWLAVIPIIFAGMVWKNVLTNNTIMYLFVYFSGVLVAAAYRHSRKPLEAESELHTLTDGQKKEGVHSIPVILNTGVLSRR